jgi:SAM-dependent methyltransferase
MNKFAELDHHYVWHPFTQMKDWLEREPVVISSGKGAVLRDAFRVLRPGGRFAVADMVALEELPAGTTNLESWAACMAGAIPETKYRALLDEAGFVDVTIDLDGDHGRVTNAYVRARKPGY